MFRQPRRQLYSNLGGPEHMRQLDDDVDTIDENMKAIRRSQAWTQRTAVVLLLSTIGTLIAVLAGG